ncbi:4-hydroxybenzoyl-CoA thioesterase [Acinetobacter junii CIP 107470 = MTCC 11364]|uniref:4-hydroxybenzoyl-CoA thioesterase n=1 Tax=Acinetobacter junii CIP 107470 = MTCC 11364 TaxID=1217666 RepID=S7WIS7_ACIJU|nr:4-hydroxybenzoyl-CoA thioesterase [Acinetobacter junii CIP 107470 = MTCC 11364]
MKFIYATKPVATGEAVMVCVGKHDSKKINIPTEIRNRIITLESSVGHHIE